MHWTKIPIHVIDFEGSYQSGILEYGIVTLFQGEIKNTQTRLCTPQGAIDLREIKTHGITHEHTQNCEPFNIEFHKIKKMRQEGPLAAHHANVENGFLKISWPHPGTVKDWLNEGKVLASWNPWIDTCALYKSIFPHLRSYKLMDLIEIFRLKEQLKYWAKQYCPKNRRRHHCALHDALASTLLIKHLGNLEGFEGLSLKWLLIHSGASQHVRNQRRQRKLDL